jgi:ribosomal protein S18 acetylase RimI-like enzyme
MKIREINRFSMRVFNAVSGLLPQLDPGAVLPSEEHLRKVLKSAGTHFFIAEEKKKITGMMTIVTYAVPTGIRVWIEDVVVDESQRGKGIGKELINYALGFAGSMGAESVDLTSRPFRIAANQLYKKSGFAIRETNVYRYTLK